MGCHHASRNLNGLTQCVKFLSDAAGARASWPLFGGIENPMTSRSTQGWENRRSSISSFIELRALELFSKYGIGDVTIDQVAEASGISRRTFYRYFDSSEAVISGLVGRSLEKLKELLLSRPVGEDLIEALVLSTVEMQSAWSDEEISRLCAMIYKADQRSWWRSIESMEPSSREIYREMVFRRLEQCGRNTKGAEFVAAAVHGVMDELTRKSWSEGDFKMEASSFRDALTAVIDGLRA